MHPKYWPTKIDVHNLEIDIHTKQTKPTQSVIPWNLSISGTIPSIWKPSRTTSKSKRRKTPTTWRQIWPCWNCTSSIQIYWTWKSLTWFCWRRWPISHTPISHFASVFCCPPKCRMRPSTTSFSWRTFWKNAISNCSGQRFTTHLTWLSTSLGFTIPFGNMCAMSLGLHSKPSDGTIWLRFWEILMVIWRK